MAELYNLQAERAREEAEMEESMENSTQIRRWQQVNRTQLAGRLAPLKNLEEGTLSVAASGAHHVVVTKEEDHICLWLHDEANENTGVIQSEMDLDEPLELVDAYTRAMLLSLLWCPTPLRVFAAGLGGGCLPTAMHHYLPETVIQCAEIDPLVVDAATRYFGFLPDALLRIFVGDGREWLEANRFGQQFDIIILDVFDDKGDVPHGLTTLEFFQLCKTSLSEQGVLVINLLYLDPLRNARVKTVSAVFDHIYLCAMDDDNDVLFAGRQPLPQKTTYIEHAIRLKQQYRFGFPFVRLALKLEPLSDDALSDWTTTSLLADEDGQAGH